MKKASGIISVIIVDPATGGMWTLKAIDSLKVILLENATDEQMTEATKIN